MAGRLGQVGLAVALDEGSSSALGITVTQLSGNITAAQDQAIEKVLAMDMAGNL